MKITSAQWIEDLRFLAKVGPPADGKRYSLPEFDWETSILKNTVPHYGQPRSFSR